MGSDVVRPAGRLKFCLMAGMLCALVLACYWPALDGGQVWDDDAHITRPDLRSGAGLVRIWTDVRATQQYYPVLHSAFWVEHQVWGDATMGYHLVNVFLHTAAACILVLVLRRLWRLNSPAENGSKRRMPPGADWLAAVLFAVHPVCVESVAWISEQKNTLSLVFYLLAALAYLDFHARRWRWSYIGALGLFILALGTKSVTATLPAALLVVLWWRQGRLDWHRDIRPLIPWFVLGLASGLFTAWVERKFVGAEGAEYVLSFGERVLLAGKVLWFYLGKLAWPADLMFLYPRWDVATAAPGWWAYVGAALAVTGLLWVMRRRFRGPLAAWLCFAGSLFPALGFFNVYPFRYSYVADHFQYLASLGVIAAVAAGVARLLERTSRRVRFAGWTLCGLVLVALMISAHRQSRIYEDKETLYRETIARNADCWLAENNLAFLIVEQPGRFDEAIGHYEQALRIRPDYAEARVNLANALARMPARMSEALAHYRETLRRKPDYAEAYYNLANALAMFPRERLEAVANYQRALHYQPEMVGAHINLANLLATMPDRMTEALEHYRKALQLQPDYAAVHYNLAITLAALPGGLPEAIEHYTQALRIEPDRVEAHVNLANALAKLPDRASEAFAHFDTALRLSPDRPETHVSLANLLAQTPGRQPEALAHYEQALRARPDYFEAHANLASYLGRVLGRSEEAVTHYEAALRINPSVPKLHHDLAALFSVLPAREADAIVHYEEALRLKPDYLEALNHLAILHAEHHRFGVARTLWERALTLDPAFADARRNLDLLKDLEKR